MMGPDLQQMLYITFTADTNIVNITVECLELMQLFWEQKQPSTATIARKPLPALTVTQKSKAIPPSRKRRIISGSPGEGAEIWENPGKSGRVGNSDLVYWVDPLPLVNH